jgi:hypothetical protein
VLHGGAAGGRPGRPGLLIKALAFQDAQNDSASALSQHCPVRPLDKTTARSSASVAKSPLVSWQPRSAWNTTRVRGRGGDRVGPRVGDRLGAQLLSQANPTTRREAMSITVARYSQPCQVGT